jgi:cytochrome b involved in lipid metabolism
MSIILVPENQEREEMHMLEMLSSKIREDSCPASVSSESSSSSTSSSEGNDNTNNTLHYYTRSEIQLHNTEASAWIVAGDNIYDVTDYVEHHPGGKCSLMKKIGGGVDCTKDLMFHSKSGQDHWKRYLVGKITKSPSKNGHIVEKEWWKFWE